MTTPVFRASELEALFRDSLGEYWNTRLEGGAEEPFYAPPAAGRPAVIRYTRDYFRSALHEVAHWCIAGDRRRSLPDFGYWYQPDGRDTAAQAEFMRVEQAPQALELIFCAACDHPFLVSLDNLSGEDAPVEPFENAVRARARQWIEEGGLPQRARLWADVLRRHYRPQGRLDGQALESVFRPMASA